MYDQFLKTQATTGKTNLGHWLSESLRHKGIQTWFRPERIHEWTLGGLSLLDLARHDPR